MRYRYALVTVSYTHLGLPVLIGIFTASVMEQEQNAGDFQNLLSLPDKPAAFLSKLLMLLVLCLCSILLLSLIHI